MTNNPEGLKEPPTPPKPLPPEEVTTNDLVAALRELHARLLVVEGRYETLRSWFLMHRHDHNGLLTAQFKDLVETLVKEDDEQ